MKPPYSAQDILSYIEMCNAENQSLQHGMNFRGDDSVFLMSTRKGAPYDDRFDRTNSILVYEGHDSPKSPGALDPKSVDQPLLTASGGPTRNKRFYDAAKAFEEGKATLPLKVRVYEKLKAGIWVFNGTFDLKRARIEKVNSRAVFKFELSLCDESAHSTVTVRTSDMQQTRLIPSSVKQAVFKRDGGQCVLCSSKDNLHFDHNLPYKHGGTSLLAENIQLLCARHNLSKGAKIV